MNFEQARFNMVEQQVRPWDVLDDRVLSALGSVEREAYVPAGFEGLAYADISIPLSDGQAMLPPRVYGRALQALQPQAGEKALIVGSGGGYFAALMAGMVDHVEVMESHAALADETAKRLDATDVDNVTVRIADMNDNLPHSYSFDVIAVTRGLPLVPQELKEALPQGGRLFVIEGDGPVMEACLYTRMTDDAWSRVSLFETEVPLLDNAEVPDPFEF